MGRNDEDKLKVPHIATYNPEEWAEEVHRVTGKGDVLAMEALLKGNPSAIEAKNIAGQTPVHIAASDGNVDALQLLKRYGADLNAVDAPNIDSSDPEEESFALNWTPLHYAANEGKTEAVKWLLENGADTSINQRDATGETPLALAINEGHKDTALLLLQKEAVVDPSIKREVEELTGKKLIEAPDIKNPDGQSCYCQEGKFTQLVRNPSRNQNQQMSLD